jgi:hypothetical protein
MLQIAPLAAARLALFWVEWQVLQWATLLAGRPLAPLPVPESEPR